MKRVTIRNGFFGQEVTQKKASKISSLTSAMEMLGDYVVKKSQNYTSHVFEAQTLLLLTNKSNFSVSLSL